MELINKIVHVFANILYSLILIYVIICIPRIFKYTPLVVLSGSMEPTIKTGSIIFYKDIPYEELKIGDIITFEANGTFVTHRIVNISGEEIETKGDANNVNDPKKINSNQVVGKVSKYTIPFLGYYVQFVDNNIAISLTVVIVILLLEFILSNKKGR